MKRKLLSALLVLAMALTLLPVAALADDVTLEAWFWADGAMANKNATKYAQEAGRPDDAKAFDDSERNTVFVQAKGLDPAKTYAISMEYPESVKPTGDDYKTDAPKGLLIGEGSPASGQTRLGYRISLNPWEDSENQGFKGLAEGTYTAHLYEVTTDGDNNKTYDEQGSGTELKLAEVTIDFGEDNTASDLINQHEDKAFFEAVEDETSKVKLYADEKDLEDAGTDAAAAIAKLITLEGVTGGTWAFENKTFTYTAPKESALAAWFWADGAMANKEATRLAKEAGKTDANFEDSERNTVFVQATKLEAGKTYAISMEYPESVKPTGDDYKTDAPKGLLIGEGSPASGQTRLGYRISLNPWEDSKNQGFKGLAAGTYTAHLYEVTENGSKTYTEVGDGAPLEIAQVTIDFGTGKTASDLIDQHEDKAFFEAETSKVKLYANEKDLENAGTDAATALAKLITLKGVTGGTWAYENKTFTYGAEKPTLTSFTPATLADTRTDSSKITKLYNDGTYRVEVDEQTPEGYDYKLNVQATSLKAHQNDDSPTSMGYWVGVKFPTVEGYTITGYKNGDKDKVTIDDNDLSAYWDFGESGDARNVSVFYTKDGAEAEVKFQIDLSGVSKYEPGETETIVVSGVGAAEPNADVVKAEIADALASAKEGTTPVVETKLEGGSGETLTGGSATVAKDIISAAKDSGVDYKVSVKDVGGVQLNTAALTAIETKVESNANAVLGVEKITDPPNAPDVANGAKNLSFDASVKVDGRAMSDEDWSGTGVKITLSFYIGEGKTDVKLYYVPASGTAVEVTGASYSAETGYVTGEVEHLSYYTAQFKEGTATPPAPETVTVTSAAAAGSIGSKVTVTTEDGGKYIIQVKRGNAASAAIYQITASGSSYEFYASAGCTVEVWKIASDAPFSGGVPADGAFTAYSGAKTV